MVRPGKLSIIGNGVVVDPWALLKEIDDARAARASRSAPDHLRIADNASPDPAAARRASTARARRRAGTRKIGTTGRGIGPAYEDKVARRAIRVCDLADPDALAERVDALLLHHNALLRGLGAPEVDGARRCSRRCSTIAPRILPYADRVWQRLDEARRARQAHPVRGRAGRTCSTSTTAPIPTSPRPTPMPARRRSARASAPRAVGYVLGITKAYTTRVGAGPFPTELDDEIGQRLGERGHEFGTVTGRKRRCGWFDAVLVRQAVKVGGIDGIALTKLDVLDGMPTLDVCTGYRYQRRAPRPLPRRARIAGRGRAGLRDAGRLVGIDPRRAQLGRPAGHRRQVYPPHRGADRGAGRPAVDQPRARRHHPGPRPVRVLSSGRNPSPCPSPSRGEGTWVQHP